MGILLTVIQKNANFFGSFLHLMFRFDFRAAHTNISSALHAVSSVGNKHGESLVLV